MKKIHRVVLAILAVAVLTAGVAAADPGVRRDSPEKPPAAAASGGESRVQDPAPENEDGGSEALLQELLFSGESSTPFFATGERGEDNPCKGGVCITCSCATRLSGCSCQGLEACDLMKKFSEMGGCTSLTCDELGDSCTCKFGG